MVSTPGAQVKSPAAQARSCALFVALLLLAAPLATADTVHLKNGNTLEGEVIKDDGVVVILRVPDGEVKLRAEDVEAIERDSPLENRLALARRQLQIGNLERAVGMFEDAWHENHAHHIRHKDL